jgi:hypothetical protein
MVTLMSRRGRGGVPNLHTQLWAFAQNPLFDDFERDVGTTNPHRNAVLAERLAHHRVFLPVRRFAKADVRAALEARTNWEDGTPKERRATVARWVREEIFPMAVLEAISAMWNVQTVRFTWSQWTTLQSHYRWTHVRAASWRRGGRVTLVVRPVLLPRPAPWHTASGQQLSAWPASRSSGWCGRPRHLESSVGRLMRSRERGSTRCPRSSVVTSTSMNRTPRRSRGRWSPRRYTTWLPRSRGRPCGR